MHNINITCPECLASFDAAEQLEQHFQQLELKEKILNEQKNRIIQLEQERTSNDQEKQELLTKFSKAKQIVKSELKQEYEESIKKAYEKGFNAAELNVKVLKREAKEAAKEELQGEIKKVSQKAFQEGMLAAEQKLHDKQEDEVTELKRQITVEKLDKARLHKQIDELQQKTQQRNVELQGEGQEVYLDEILSKHFPNDVVKEVKKGASGQDCTLAINHRNTEGFVEIAFESKNTKNFSEGWIEKFHKDLIEKKIPYGILASKALPQNFNHIEYRAGSIFVIPFRESLIAGVTNVVREMAIKEAELRNMSLLDESEKGRLYERLLSPQVKMQVTALLRTFVSTQNGIDEDEKSNLKSILRRQANLKELKQQLLKVFGTIAGSDNKLADNLIFSEEEIHTDEKISHIKSLKGPNA